MKKSLIIIFMMCIGIGLLLGDIPNVFAQQSENEYTLEEITVTAQKREENVQKVPIAMEVISGSEMTEMGKNDIDQILSNISNVIINKAADGLRVSIRGMANDQNVFGNLQVATPTVAVNTDGVYTNRDSTGTNLYDIERVEVLSGPQSTLYASATPGGIVNIITSDPKTEKYEGSGSLEYGNFNYLHTNGVLNVPIGEKVALRASFLTSVRDGYVSNGSDDEDSKSARLKALFQPTEKLSFMVTGELTKTGGQGSSGVVAFAEQDEAKPNPWQASSTEAGPARNNEQKKINGRINLDLGFATLAITPAYSKHDMDSNQNRVSDGRGNIPLGTAYTSHQTMGGEEKNIELRMASSTDSFMKWILGANYYYSRDDSINDDILDSVVVSETHSYNRQKTKAIYGNLTYPVTDRFRATGGMRYTWDTNFTYNMEPNAPPDIKMPQLVDMKYSNPDYKVGVEYDLATSSMLYADYATSYRTQGMALNAEGNPMPPEHLKSYSIGSKSRFLENKIQVNAAAYYYDYTNFLVTGGANTLYDANGNGVRDEGENTSTRDENGKQVGDAKVYGLDLQTTTILTANDKLDVSVSYLKKYFTHLYFDWYGITNDLGIPDLDYSGKDMTYAPHWNISLGYDHIFQLWNGGTLTARIDSKYQSAYRMYYGDRKLNIVLNDDGTTTVDVMEIEPFQHQEGYHLTNLSLIYGNPDGKWTFTAYVKNAEDYAVKRSLEVMQNVGTLMIGPPRTFGGILSVKF